MVDGDYSGNIVGKSGESKKKLEGLYLFVIGALIGIVLCGAFVALLPSSSSNGVDANTAVKIAYANSECLMRSTDTILWFPSMVTQVDSQGNISGIPVCIPLDRKTGQRLKNI